MDGSAAPEENLETALSAVNIACPSHRPANNKHHRGRSEHACAAQAHDQVQSLPAPCPVSVVALKAAAHKLSHLSATLEIVLSRVLPFASLGKHGRQK